jgi:putative addiction module component (TIGR02574 family)
MISFCHGPFRARDRIKGPEAPAQGARARLAQRLISSLDPKFDPDAEQVWIEEAERRLDELESGKVAGIPAEQVLERARSTLR